jgi:hypothetical protein
MNDVDPSIEYARVMHTDGHNWKLYEVHHSHVKKTKFFSPRQNSRKAQNKIALHTDTPRFFDDYEHMLSVIGLLRFAMGISENIVEASEVYEIQELENDPQRTIRRSYLTKSATDFTGTKFRLPGHSEVVQQIAHDSAKDP